MMFVTTGSTNDNHMMAYNVCFKINGKLPAVHDGRHSCVHMACLKWNLDQKSSIVMFQFIKLVFGQTV